MASISGKVDPVVRRITATDIAEALVQGLRDFQAVPLYGLAFGALYAGGGIVILLCLTAFGMVYLAYPLAAGFALIGPFVAIGLYEVSRRRETGQQHLLPHAVPLHSRRAGLHEGRALEHRRCCQRHQICRKTFHGRTPWVEDRTTHGSIIRIHNK